MDFIKDLREFAIQNLLYHKVAFSEEAKTHDLLMRMNLFYGQWIEPKIRTVMISRELAQKIQDVELIPTHICVAFDKIKKWIESGIDINSFQGKKILNEDMRDDYQYSLYGIRHLHLSAKACDELPVVKNDGFSKRSGYLLLVYFEKDKAYLIDIQKHPAGNPEELKNWTTKDIITTIEGNWPEIIEKYKMKEVASLSPEVDDQGIYDLASNGICTIIQTENGVYMPLGMGVASSRDNILSVIKADQMYNEARLCEKWIFENIDALRKIIKQYAGEPTSKAFNYFDFHYEYSDMEKAFIIKERVSGIYYAPNRGKLFVPNDRKTSSLSCHYNTFQKC